MLFRKTIFIWLFLISTVWAADSNRLITYPPQKLMGFRGLDTSSAAPNIVDGRAKDLQNVKLSRAFDVRKRDGYSVINDTLDDLDIDSPAINGIFDAEYSDGTSWTIAFVGKKIKYDNSGTWTEIGLAHQTPTVTTGQNNQWQCVMALDEAVCTNDTDVPIKINSTPRKDSLAFTGLSNAVTKAKAVTWFRNYLIFGNTFENSVELPTRFRWSNVGTIETWSDDDFSDISSLGGDEIIGFAELYGNLYILLKKSIWKASLVGGDDVFSFSKVVDKVGSIAKGSIQVISFPDGRQSVFFLTEDKHIFSFNGVAIEEIDALVQTTVDDLGAVRLEYAVSVFDGTSYFLCGTNSTGSVNDTCYEYNTEIREWSKTAGINANAMARVKESDSTVKTYFGNYKAFVYWLDNPDLNNDVDGAIGLVDSVGTLSVDTITGAQIIIDSDLTTGTYTGATIEIVGGTGDGESAVITTMTSTGVVVASAFSTTPDSTSQYSIGAINAYYDTKWYDLGDATRKKNYKELFYWTAENSNDAVTIDYSNDFKTLIDSKNQTLSPSGGTSLWDTALWDVGTWGSTGDRFNRLDIKGVGRFINFKFTNAEVDESFQIYGFNIVAEALDVR